MPVESTDRRLLVELTRAQIDGRLPSVRAGLIRDDAVCWRGAVGATGDDPYDEQLRIGSITKTMTAVLIHQLVRDGLLSLDQPVADVLGDVGYGDRTSRMLLAHSSGMQSEPAGSWWERSPGREWAQLVADNDGSAAAFETGQQYHYSNLGFALLGRVAAELIGTDWFDAVRTRILQPLEMSRTSYLPQAPSAQGWSVHPYAGTLTPEPATDTGAMAPAGQVWASLDDLARYARFLLTGHPDVLSRDLLLDATHPQSGDRHSRLAAGYGLGLALFRGGSGVLYGHTGSMPGFLAACLVDPIRQTGAVVLSNATSGLSPAGLAGRLLETLEECEPTLPPAWQPVPFVPAAVEPVLGLWHWGNTPHVFRLASAGEAHGVEIAEVVAEVGGQVVDRFELRGDILVGVSGYHAGERVRVVRHRDGTVSHLDIATFIYTREPYDPLAPIPGGAPA